MGEMVNEWYDTARDILATETSKQTTVQRNATNNTALKLNWKAAAAAVCSPFIAVRPKSCCSLKNAMHKMKIQNCVKCNEKLRMAEHSGSTRDCHIYPIWFFCCLVGFCPPQISPHFSRHKVFIMVVIYTYISKWMHFFPLFCYPFIFYMCSCDSIYVILSVCNSSNALMPKFLNANGCILFRFLLILQQTYLWLHSKHHGSVCIPAKAHEFNSSNQ